MREASVSPRFAPTFLVILLVVAAPVWAQENEPEAEIEDDPAAPPAAPEPVTIVLTAHQEGSAFWFQREGQAGRNPTLYVTPGAEVTIVLRGVTGFHNVNVDGVAKTAIIGPGKEASITFTAPESGSLDYWCDPHKANGMGGKMVAGAAPGGGATPPPSGGDITGASVDLGDLGYPECAGYKIPAIAAQPEVVGGPKVSDYVEQCTAAGTTGRAMSGADLVIPMSWALIGLGIVGVVWVHRKYRP